MQAHPSRTENNSHQEHHCRTKQISGADSPFIMNPVIIGVAKLSMLRAAEGKNSDFRADPSAFRCLKAVSDPVKFAPIEAVAEVDHCVFVNLSAEIENISLQRNRRRLRALPALVGVLPRYLPDGKPCDNGVCAGPNAQRIGFDMCPANEWVKEVVTHEVAKVLPSGVDYMQYFDQNLGGSCYRCYAKSHGHPSGPGIWQNEAMKDLYRRLQELVKRSGRKTLIGCEAAAAEPFLPYLLFNDNRFHLNLHAGTPVPAYAFVNHEYLNNFMGNQNAVVIIHGGTPRERRRQHPLAGLLEPCLIYLEYQLIVHL